MPLDARDLDLVRRSHKGTRGFLDLQDAANADIQLGFAPILERTGDDFALCFANLLEAGKFAVAAELKVRESHRLASVGRGEPLDGPDVPYNAQAIATAQRALKQLRVTQGAFDQEPLAQLRDAHREPEVARAIEDGREALVQHLVKFNIGIEDFGEVLEIWDENAKIASDGGAEGLLRNLDEQLERFIELRGEDDRGTRPHSPLPWWKWCVIAWLASSAVFAVIACFIWGACTWVWALIGALAPWVFGMIDRGC